MKKKGQHRGERATSRIETKLINNRRPYEVPADARKVDAVVNSAVSERERERAMTLKPSIYQNHHRYCSYPITLPPIQLASYRLASNMQVQAMIKIWW